MYTAARWPLFQLVRKMSAGRMLVAGISDGTSFLGVKAADWEAEKSTKRSAILFPPQNGHGDWQRDFVLPSPRMLQQNKLTTATLKHAHTRIPAKIGRLQGGFQEQEPLDIPPLKSLIDMYNIYHTLKFHLIHPFPIMWVDTRVC